MNVYEAFAFVSKVINLQGFYFSLHDHNSQPFKSYRVILSIIYYVIITTIHFMVLYRSQISAAEEVSLLNDLKGSRVVDNFIFFFFFISRSILLSIVHFIAIVTIFTGNQSISMFFKLLNSFDGNCVAFLQTKRLNENYSKVINTISITFIVHLICNNIYIFVHSGSSMREKVIYMTGTILHFNLKFHILIMVFLIGAIDIRLKHYLLILKSKKSIQSQSEFNLLINLYKDIIEMIRIYNQLFGVPLTLQIITVLVDILAVLSGTYTQFNQLEITVDGVFFAIFNVLYFVPSFLFVISLLYIADHIHEMVN